MNQAETGFDAASTRGGQGRRRRSGVALRPVTAGLFSFSAPHSTGRRGLPTAGKRRSRRRDQSTPLSPGAARRLPGNAAGQAIAVVS